MMNNDFDKFVYGIGGIPSTYLASLSYEEQLLWFSKNLQELMENINIASSIEDYEELIEILNATKKDEINVGQSFHIQSLNVPDLWISASFDDSIPYTYTTDEAIINALKTTGFIRVGYFNIMSIEALTDLTDYYTKDEIATILADYVKTTDLPEILSGYEVVSNKVTSLSSSSTDTEYPSAKCVYDIIGDVESLLEVI